MIPWGEINMQFRKLSIFAAMLSVCFVPAALAHHSNAMYERDKTLEVTGTVREFQWTNPHTFIELQVETSSGTQNFTIEGPTPGVLRANGWKYNQLKAGDMIVVAYHPLKSGQLGGGLISMTKDGVTLQAGSTSNYESGK
jgi:Family of unknown function (DUF6152)